MFPNKLGLETEMSDSYLYEEGVRTFRESLWIGEGNGNPLQCSCLEIPRDGGAWWAAVYGVAQRRTRPK